MDKTTRHHKIAARWVLLMLGALLAACASAAPETPVLPRAQTPLLHASGGVSGSQSTSWASWFSGDSDRALVWLMINVSPEYPQGPLQIGDSHLLIDANGTAVLIDAGEKHIAEQSVIPLLQALGIAKLSAVLVSHPHSDHYGGVLALLEKRFSIGAIYMYIPPKELCDSDPEKSACKYDDLMTIRDLARRNRTPLRSPSAFQPVTWVGGQTLRTFSYYESADCPIKPCVFNDMSWIMSLQAGQTTVLFTGDLQKDMGDWLISQGKDLQAQILKAPHHGGGSSTDATDAFYKAVNPTSVLIPTPSLKYSGYFPDAPAVPDDSNRRIRDVLRELRAKVFVNGLVGGVTVRLRPDGGYIIGSDCPVPALPGCAPWSEGNSSAPATH